VNRVFLSSPAKINLYLEVVGPRSDGYTNVVLVFQSIALADRVALQNAPETTIRCQHPAVPCDETNLAYRAVQLIQELTGIQQGVQVEIEKNIPVAAGLAGGSGNGAAVLVGLNQLWELGLNAQQLAGLGAHLGSDVPFCLRGGTALGYGRGEVLASLTSPGLLPLVLAKPRTLAVSTAWAYRTFRELAESHAGGHLALFLSNLVDPRSKPLSSLLYNDLERAVLPHHPLVQRLKTHLQDRGGLGVLMSGSGPTIFALAQDLDHAHELADSLDPAEYEIFVTTTQDQGVILTGSIQEF